MARGYNMAVLVGNLTRDIEINNYNGKDCGRFSIAVSDDYKNKATGEKVKQTDFINCVAWGYTATNLAKFVHKGMPVLVSGKIKTRQYEKDGQKRYSTEVLVSDFTLISSGHKAAEEAPADNSDIQDEVNANIDFAFGTNAGAESV